MEGPSEPVFVLIRPQLGENVGAAARAMWNFGLTRMRLVEPRDGWPNPRAVAMASGAGRVLDGVQIHADTLSATADCTRVYATTARSRDMTKDVLTPEAAMVDAVRRMVAGERVAVLFGPERTGMENDDVALANVIVSVPVNPDFSSLNLAQCVLLLAYEWRRATLAAQPDPAALAPAIQAGDEPASVLEMDHLARHYEERLDQARFFFPADKGPAMRLSLRNLWSRMPLTVRDVQMLHGILRQLVRSGGAAEPPARDDTPGGPASRQP